MVLILGLVGESLSGKGMFFDLLKELAPNLTIHYERFSNPLREAADVMHIPKTKPNLQLLSTILREHFGPDVLVNALRQRIQTVQAIIIVLDGVRVPADIEFIYSFPNALLGYVTASLEVRYRRRLRNENVGEAEMSMEDFMKMEVAETESYIADIGPRADFAIANNSLDESIASREHYKQQVAQIYADYILPALN